MACTIGRALPNRYQLLVGRLRLVRWFIREVRTMSLNCSACVIRGIGLCFHLSIGERESEQTLCGDCLRPDCYHLEQARGRV